MLFRVVSTTELMSYQSCLISIRRELTQSFVVDNVCTTNSDEADVLDNKVF